MATNIGYARHKNRDRDERAHTMQHILRKMKGAALKVIRALSFDADNIFKSKEWPYY